MSSRIKIDNQKVGFFRFKKLNENYLLTNEIGEYCFLTPLEFELFLTGNLTQLHPSRYSQLLNKGFVRSWLDFGGLAEKYVRKNIFLRSGPSLHIIVVTLRCDHKCIYCQTGSKPLNLKEWDMEISTAEKVVDKIFKSPNPCITIEFQGGEPLLNFDIIKFIIEYAQKKNKKEKKDLRFSLVTNLTFMKEEYLEYLIKNKVGICTSLDGPEVLHNKQRIFDKGNSYKNTIKWLRIIRKEYEKNNFVSRPQALVTITRFSLPYFKEIIDCYIKLGLEGIHLRPVNPFGIKKEIWRKIKVSSNEFIEFYRKSMNYILELNLKNINFYERTAKIFLSKIFCETDPNYLDIRSPCGAGIGQLAYNFDGDVYVCDEARMLAAQGDKTFKVGNVFENSYEDFINTDVVKTLCSASCLETIPKCNDCVYRPYCGVCPVYNYATEGNIFSQIPNNERCKIHGGILDYIFEKLKEKRIKRILLRWIEE